MIDWLAPALGFVLTQASLGVTMKFALRGIDWPQILLSAGLVYVLTASILVALEDTTLPFGAGWQWGALSGICAAATLVLFFVALRGGQASQVVPVTAAYPMASAIMAAILLSESITPLRAIGTGLVVTGIVILGRE